MSAPLTQEQALDLAKTHLTPWYICQDGPHTIQPWKWWLFPGKPKIVMGQNFWSGSGGRCLGQGAPNEAWRETLTEVREGEA